jgi:hypothetical protein
VYILGDDQKSAKSIEYDLNLVADDKCRNLERYVKECQDMQKREQEKKAAA